MKIAIVAPTYIPARRANTVQVMKMTQAFARLGHEVRLAVPGHPPAPWEQLAHHYGLQTRFVIDWLPVAPVLRRFDYGWRAYRWARRWGAELLYTRLPQSAALGSQLGLATVFECHDMPVGAGRTLFRLFTHGRGARQLVVISHALAEDLAREMGVPANPAFTRVAPDGVDIERYANPSDTQNARRTLQEQMGLKLPQNGFIAGYTGHLYPGRGTELILEIAGRLPEVSFLIAGGEPVDVGRWKAEAERRGLENVALTGFVPNADIPVYQAACDVLLMPYQLHVAASSGGDIARYLSPMKLFEYMACGRPILSSDLPVLREVLSDSNAVLLPAEDPEAWTAVLKQLRDNPQAAAELGQRARQESGQYTWEGRAARVLEGL
jgi:glycosyltransferase involved in cell wall biosynthesis